MSRLQVPDSTFVKEVESLVEQQHSPTLLAHCYRTWAFGWTVGEAFDLKPDPEALYAACLMHDLGLSAGCQHQIKDTGFQILGARKAYGICHEQQQGEAMGRLIYEAISQHLNPWLSPKKVSPEAFLLKTGAHMDVIGIYRHWLSHEAMTVIHERYPRTEFANEIADTMINLPHHSCSHAGFLNGLGFEKLALTNPLNKTFTAPQYAKQ